MRRLALGMGCMLALLAGCGGEQSDLAESATTVHREIIDGAGRTYGSVSVDRTALITGQRVTVRVEVEFGSIDGRKLESIDFESALPEDVELINQRELERVAGDSDFWRVVQEYDIEPMLPGQYEIGLISIATSLQGMPSAASTTEPIMIAVASAFAEGDEVAFSDVTGVVDPKAEPIAWWVWASIGGGALLVLALGAWMLIRLTRVREAKPSYRAAHELALERLDKLSAMDYPAQGKLEKLHDEASLILRCYIEDRYLLHAPERTTEEFLHEARSSALLMEEEVIALEVFLRQCDMVKFACFEPASNQADRTLQTVRDFVERTKSADKLVAFLNGQIVGRVDRHELEKVA